MAASCSQHPKSKVWVQVVCSSVPPDPFWEPRHAAARSSAQTDGMGAQGSRATACTGCQASRKVVPLLVASCVRLASVACEHIFCATGCAAAGHAPTCALHSECRAVVSAMQRVLWVKSYHLPGTPVHERPLRGAQHGSNELGCTWPAATVTNFKPCRPPSLAGPHFRGRPRHGRPRGHRALPCSAAADGRHGRAHWRRGRRRWAVVLAADALPLSGAAQPWSAGGARQSRPVADALTHRPLLPACLPPSPPARMGVPFRRRKRRAEVSQRAGPARGLPSRHQARRCALLSSCLVLGGARGVAPGGARAAGVLCLPIRGQPDGAFSVTLGGVHAGELQLTCMHPYHDTLPPSRCSQTHGHAQASMVNLRTLASTCRRPGPAAEELSPSARASLIFSCSVSCLCL